MIMMIIIFTLNNRKQYLLIKIQIDRVKMSNNLATKIIILNKTRSQNNFTHKKFNKNNKVIIKVIVLK